VWLGHNVCDLALVGDRVWVLILAWRPGDGKWELGNGKGNWLVTLRNYRTLLAHLQVTSFYASDYSNSFYS